jgi:hypothetical protein
MFIAVWILYAADRLLDARSGDDANLEERHRFHDRHRKFFVTLIALAALALAALTHELLPNALRLYALLGALLAAWFLLIHTRLAHERRLPKELAVGIFFAAAIFIPTVARRPDLRLPLLAPAALFAAVCALNCIYLYAWEHPGNRLHANWSTRIATRHLTRVAAAILTAAFLCETLFNFAPFASKSFSPDGTTPLWLIPAACTISTFIFITLNHFRAKISPLTLRAVADLALLTPLLFTPFTR